jgi:hypothetical protein
MRALSLLAGLAILAGSASARAESVDLTSYLAPRPQVGDFRVYVPTGATAESRYDAARSKTCPVDGASTGSGAGCGTRRSSVRASRSEGSPATTHRRSAAGTPSTTT